MMSRGPSKNALGGNCDFSEMAQTVENSIGYIAQLMNEGIINVFYKLESACFPQIVKK